MVSVGWPNVFDDSEYSQKYSDEYKKISSYEDIIKFISSNIDIKDIEFYILGGSCFNISLGRRLEYTQDIDIFFPNETEYLKMHERLKEKMKDSTSLTKNAITFNLGRNVQLIKRNFGSVENIISKFDLNKSRIGFIKKKDSLEYIEYEHKDFKEDLFVYYENLKGDTLTRFMKYSKRLEKFYKKETRKIMSFILENEKNISFAYTDNFISPEVERKKLFFDIINVGLNEDKEFKSKFVKEYIDIISQYSLYKINKIANEIGYENINHHRARFPEYLNVDKFMFFDPKLSNDCSLEFKMKYPQYFI